MLAVVSFFLVVSAVGGAFLCRVRWRGFSLRVKHLLLAGAILFLASYGLMVRFHWVFASTLTNEAVGAAAVGGYVLLALFLTLFRPQIATRCIAILLLLPVPLMFLYLPSLAHSQFPIVTEHVAGNLFVNKVRWDAGAMGSSGTTLILFEPLRGAPFMRHYLQKVVFDDRACLSSKAFLVMQADGRHVMARCPWQDPQKEGFHDFLVPLY